jgi:hypothetical protein
MRRGLFALPFSAICLVSWCREHLCPKYAAVPGPRLRANGFIVPAKRWMPDRFVIQPS